jgi:hypothetical protein
LEALRLLDVAECARDALDLNMKISSDDAASFHMRQDCVEFPPDPEYQIVA